MGSTQGTTPPVSNWLDLPLGIIYNIYRHLDDVCDIGHLRLTCTRFGKEGMRKTTQAYLYQEIPLTFVQPRVETFLRMTRSCVQNGELNDQPSAAWVKKIVIENAMPVDTYNLGLSYMTAAWQSYGLYLFAQSRFLRSLKDSYPDLYRSVGFLNNLDTIEYISGFRTEGASPSTGETIRLLKDADAITGPTSANRSDWAQQLTTKLWKHKEYFWGNAILCERKHTNMLIKAALENESCKGPLRLIITSVADSTLFSWYQQWPEDNRLQVLEIQYLGRNMSNAGDNIADLLSLCDAGQFSNLRNMSWAGVSLHQKGSLNLKYLGHELFMPTWPFLSTLEFHNIMLASRSVQYLKELRIHARFKNIVWLENSITGFEKGSSLQVICLGIQVVHYALVSYTTIPLAVDPFPEDYKYGGDIPSKIFLVAYDLEDAQKIAASNAAYCSPMVLEDGETIAVVPPESMSRYMIDGGYCPIDGIEDGGAVWAENWQM